MAKILIKLFLNGLAVFVASYVTPGVKLDSFLVAILVAVVLGVLNTILRPILVILTLPINILSLGLFTLIINVVIIMMASSLVPGFKVDGFLPALIFSIILSLVNGFLSILK